MKYLLLLLLFCMSCSSDEIVVDPTPNNSFSDCDSNTLAVISDGESCEEENFNLNVTCEIFEIEETQFIDEDAYVWAPNICSLEIGDQISFSNQGNTSFLKVVDKGHYIAEERIFLECNDMYEHGAAICQKNEVIYTSFLNDIIGPDTLIFELRSRTQSYNGQELGEKRNIISLKQPRTNSNVLNFWLIHLIGDDYYEGPYYQSYKADILLNGNSYADVVEYKTIESIDPDNQFKYFLQKEKGILGFEIDGELWISE